jgi:cyclopropane fatty-acyl-phospholipid synthase-like methyltransferase
MRMNSATGKEILSLVREGDYAHPGEEQAIDIVFASLPKKPDRQLLDIGCGRGGTADYVRRHGWGEVTGVDIDGETLANSAKRYPEVEFYVDDVTTIGKRWQAKFDLIYLFNSFYAFPDQQEALRQMRTVATKDGFLTIFDYTDLTGNFRDFANEAQSFWQPVNLRTFPDSLQSAGWELQQINDLSAEYHLWYQQLCARFDDRKPEIVNRFGQDWYDYASGTYVDLLNLVETGIVGGTIIRARALEN